MIEFLFLDLDDTILDFHAAEQVAIRQTLRQFGLEPTEEVLDAYHRINKWHWQQLELGNLTRNQVLEGRFQALFAETDIQADSAACAGAYTEDLSHCCQFIPGALEALEALRKKYRLYLASNGTAWVQRRRIAGAELAPYFEDIFISQELGHNKPSRDYFDACFARIPRFDPAQAMIVGDSLSSDILGGINAGIRTCWVNPGHAQAPEGLQPDLEIEDLSQLEALLEDQKNTCLFGWYP